MIRKNKIIIFIGINLIVGGCHANSRDSIMSTQVETNTSIPSLEITSETKENTITVTQASVQATDIPDPKLTPTCNQVIDGDLSDLKSEGFLIIDTWNEGETPFAYDFYDDHTVELTKDVRSLNWYVSPDELHLVHDDYYLTEDGEGKYRYTLVDNQGNIFNLDAFSDGGQFINWVDNENVLVGYPKSGFLHTYIFKNVNILTGEIKELPDDFPEADSEDPDTFQYFPFVFDPTLTRVVYPVIEDEAGFKGTVLRDIEKHMNLIHTELSHDEPSVWSPDGEYLAHFSSQGFIYDRDGDLIYRYDQDRINGVTSWSPDNQKIAFWSGPGGSYDDRLMVLDLSNQQILDSCITTDRSEPFKIVWSPGSTQLIAVGKFGENYFPIVMDLEENKIINLGLKEVPEVWLNSLPEVWINNSSE